MKSFHRLLERFLVSFALLFVPVFLGQALCEENASTQQPEKSHRFNTATFTPAPALALSGGQGVSGAFAGVAGNRVLVAGGCNFPDTAAADGGRK
ncbi:MAG: hypothetical protein K6C30_03220, partial [Bacteroidaceae bacterium]|nr:hypothetical protein [Bacteroidaceae bacterium]